MASRSSAPQHHSPHQQQQQRTTAPVLEYLCLFTHDLKRKQKRWQDGKLRYHAFNGKAVVHDERGNLVGDAHAHEPPCEGDEMQLERGGGVLVQVASEVVDVKQQDLSAVVDRRVAEREERARAKVSAAAARSSGRMAMMGRPATGPVVVHTPVRNEADHMRHRPLASVIGTPTGHHGRALVPSESPFEQRHHQQPQQKISMNHTAGEATPMPATKRRRYEQDSPPSKAGYAQNLFGAKLNLSSQPTSSLQSLRAAASQRRIAERTARLENEEERGIGKGLTTRPAARDIGRPALGASRSQEIVVSDDDEEEATPAREVFRQEARLPAARPAVRSVVHTTPRRSAVGQMVRQSIDAAMQQRSHESSTSPGQSMPRRATTTRQESQRPRVPDPIPSGSEIIDIDADEEPGPQLSAPPRQIPVAQQRKKKQLLSRGTERGSRSVGDIENSSRTAKGATTSSVEPNAGEEGRAATHAPARDEPRTELRIKSRKKRGLLMVAEKIAPPKPASERPGTRLAERESSETLVAEKSDPFASSSPERTGETGRDSAPSRGSRNSNTADSIGHSAQEVSNYDQDGLNFLLDDGDTPFSVVDEPISSRVLKDCTNTIQSRNTDGQDKTKQKTPELQKESSTSVRVTAAPISLGASSEAGLGEKEAEPVEADILPEDDSDNVQIVRKRNRSGTKEARKRATSPVVPDASDDDDGPILPTTTRRLAQKARRNARATSASVDLSSDEEPIVAEQTKRLIRDDSRSTKQPETSLDRSSDEEILPRQRSKRAAQRRHKDSVVMSLEDDDSDHAPPTKAKSKRRLRSKSRDDEELAALRHDDDEASEDMPAPPPKKRARKRTKDKSEQDDESNTSAREAKPAPRLARLSRKSVKSRELIGFNFDEPRGPMTSLIGAAKTVVNVQSRNASEASAETGREGSDARVGLGNDRTSCDVPVEPVAPPSPPKMKRVEPLAVDAIKPVEEEPVALQNPRRGQVSEAAKATGTPIAVKETMAIASKIIDDWESQHGKATSTTALQEPPARTVNGLVLEKAPAPEGNIAKCTQQSHKAMEPAVKGVTEVVPTVPALPQGDSTLSTKSAPAETTATEPDKADETPCEPRPQQQPQPQPPQPAGRLFRRQASVGMMPPAAGSGAPRIANPASRGRKAALKSDAAGQVPQSILSASTLYGGAGGGSMLSMMQMQMQMQMMSAQGGAASPAEALEPQPPPAKKVKKMTFPGFQPAGGSGPWSREAFDLLEMGRPL